MSEKPNVQTAAAAADGQLKAAYDTVYELLVRAVPLNPEHEVIEGLCIALGAIEKSRESLPILSAFGNARLLGKLEHLFAA